MWKEIYDASHRQSTPSFVVRSYVCWMMQMRHFMLAILVVGLLGLPSADGMPTVRKEGHHSETNVDVRRAGSVVTGEIDDRRNHLSNSSSDQADGTAAVVAAHASHQDEAGVARVAHQKQLVAQNEWDAAPIQLHDNIFFQVDSNSSNKSGMRKREANRRTSRRLKSDRRTSKEYRSTTDSSTLTESSTLTDRRVALPPTLVTLLRRQRAKKKRKQLLEEQQKKAREEDEDPEIEMVEPMDLPTEGIVVAEEEIEVIPDDAEIRKRAPPKRLIRSEHGGPSVVTGPLLEERRDEARVLSVVSRTDGAAGMLRRELPSAVSDSNTILPVFLGTLMVSTVAFVCCVKYVRLSLSAFATRLWDPKPVRDGKSCPPSAASTAAAVALKATSSAYNSDRKKKTKKFRNGSSVFRCRIEALHRCSAGDVKELLPRACSYDCALSKPLRSHRVLRLEAEIASPLGPSARPLLAPLTEQECVMFTATVSKRIRGQGLALSFAAANVDFTASLLDDPSTRVEVMGYDVTLFDMHHGHFVQTGTFATAPDQWQVFVLDNQVEALPGAKLSAAQLTDEDTPLEFLESALLIGSKVTLVGELCRGPSGTLMLQPLEPEWGRKRPKATVTEKTDAAKLDNDERQSPSPSDSEDTSSTATSSATSGAEEPEPVSQKSQKPRLFSDARGLQRTVYCSDDPNLLPGCEEDQH